MLVEAPEEASKVKTYLGTVVWRLDNVSDGQNQAVGLAVRADMDLPDDKMKASVVFQKNTDASLPASHTLKIRFIVQPGSPSGNIKEINVPQMRREDSATGDALDGVTVPIVENSFLIGLTPGNSENANLDLLKSRDWIDIPIRLSNGKIAKLTFEKTDVGQRDLQEAGVQLRAAVGLHEAAQFCVVTVGTDVGVDLIGDLTIMPSPLAVFRVIALGQYPGIAVE